MAVYERKQVVLNNLTGEFTTDDITNDTVLVTWTATMAHGSLLDASDAEVDLAGIANAVKVVNTPAIDLQGYEVGDTVALNVAVRGCVFNVDALLTSDRDVVTAAALTGLAGSMNTFKE